MTEVTAQEFELKITKELPAPREDVFAAWTNPDHLKEWISPTGHGATVPLLEARKGGQYRIDMHGDSETYVHTGEYLEFRPPGKLVVTWISPLFHGVVLTRGLTLGILEWTMLINVVYLTAVGVLGSWITSRRIGALLRP